jgi:CRP/FNR family transcriptional regulator
MDKIVSAKIEKFFSAYPLKVYDVRQILIHAGEEPVGIIHLLKGQVRQYDITDKGDEVVVNVFKPPAFFPMLWAINKTPNQYFYEASTAVEARIAPAADSVRFVKSNPDVTFDLLSRLYSGVEGMQRRMAHLMGGNSRSRILFELALECKRFAVQRSDGSFILSLHEDELAHRCGLARETVSRELGELRKQRILEIDHNHFIVKDLAYIENQLGSTI